MISSILADRVRRLIPMLSSSFDGEVIATRNAIGRELSAGGSDWHGLAESVFGADRPPPPLCSATSPTFAEMARACRDTDHGRLTPRERAFVYQMCALGFNGRPSPKQRDWLAAIFDRLQRRAAA